jgi:hypothetical protein
VTVAYFAITSCSPRFNPTFQLFNGKSVRLNRQTLTDISPSGRVVSEVRYQQLGATANAFFWEIYSAGNPSNYKSCVQKRDWQATGLGTHDPKSVAYVMAWV